MPQAAAPAISSYGTFGTGDVTLNENVELVLTSRGARNDMIADSAALHLARTPRGSSRVTLRAGVEETVRLLCINDEIQDTGTWGSSESPAEHKNDDFFSGPGILRVVPQHIPRNGAGPYGAGHLHRQRSSLDPKTAAIAKRTVHGDPFAVQIDHA